MVHASRLKPLSAFKHFKGKVSEKTRSETLEKDGLKVVITLEPFDPKKRKLTFVEIEGSRYLSKIDDQPYWGTDGALPLEQGREITVQKNGKTMTVPNEALKDLFNPGLYPGNTMVSLNPKDGAIYITSFNSDGAGGYVAGFVFKNGKFNSRAVFSPF
ncbi:MAG: hypothetical protein ACON38_19085 [Akkermansiaceae bacterium]